MGVKISQLPAVSVPALTDIFPIVQEGVTYQETCTQLADLLATAGNLVSINGASVVGDIPLFDSTSGEVVDSGIKGSGVTANALQVLTATVTLPTSQVNAAYAAPVILLSSPGTGKAIIVLNAILYTNVTTAWTSGGNAYIQYGNTVHGAGTNALSAAFPTADITAAVSQLDSIPGSTLSALTAISATGLYFSNHTAAFATGTNSTLTFTIQYCIVSATV